MKGEFLYLTNNAFALSETFKRDLVVGLLSEGLSLDVIADQVIGYGREMKEVTCCNYLSSKPMLRRILIAGSSKMGSRIIENALLAYQCRISSRVLAKVIGRKNYGAVFVDYGTVACEVLDFFRHRGTPVVVHFHGYDITSSLRNHWYARKLRELFQYASRLVVASHHMRRLLVLNGAPPAKIEVIRYGLEPASIPLAPRNEKTNYPSVVFLGRLTPKKHPVALIEAFKVVTKRLPEARLMIVGDGPERMRVEERIEQLALKERVRLYGALPQEDALKVLRKGWIYAQHSVTALSGDQEGFGISLAEAAAMGIPVVSTIHNGIVEQVEDNVTGFLVPEFNYEAMGERMVYLLVNPNLIAQMGLKARERIFRLCNPKQRLTMIAQILKESEAAKTRA